LLVCSEFLPPTALPTTNRWAPIGLDTPAEPNKNLQAWFSRPLKVPMGQE